MLVCQHTMRLLDMKISDKLKSKLKIEKAKLLAVAEYPWSKHNRFIQEKQLLKKKDYLYSSNKVFVLYKSGFVVNHEWQSSLQAHYMIKCWLTTGCSDMKQQN